MGALVGPSRDWQVFLYGLAAVLFAVSAVVKAAPRAKVYVEFTAAGLLVFLIVFLWGALAIPH